MECAWECCAHTPHVSRRCDITLLRRKYLRSKNCLRGGPPDPFPPRRYLHTVTRNDCKSLKIIKNCLRGGPPDPTPPRRPPSSGATRRCIRRLRGKKTSLYFRRYYAPTTQVPPVGKLPLRRTSGPNPSRRYLRKITRNCWKSLKIIKNCLPAGSPDPTPPRRPPSSGASRIMLPL